MENSALLNGNDAPSFQHYILGMEMHMDRIRKIQQQINQGTYHMIGSLIAQCMIETAVVNSIYRREQVLQTMMGIQREYGTND